MNDLPLTPPPLPTPPPPPPRPRAAPAPPVVQVVNHGPGFGRLVGAGITAMSAMAFVFGAGMLACVLLFTIIGLSVAGFSSGDGLQSMITSTTYRSGGSRTVAILPVSGVIDGAKAQFIRAGVESILSDRNVKAVVLRVNSPGGGVTASDEIWHEVGRLKAKGLTVVTSMGSVAASGGYYVACGTDHIVAQETTVTGSIGVIAQVLTFEGLFEKVGVKPVTLVATRSPEKHVANDAFRDWTDADREQITTLLDHSYDIFRDRVATGRASLITDEKVLDDIADGSVFTASEALELKLIDGIGYLDDAIAQAETRAGLRAGQATVKIVTPRPSLFGGFPLGLSRKPFAENDANQWRTLVNDLSRVRLMYLAP